MTITQSTRRCCSLLIKESIRTRSTWPQGTGTFLALRKGGWGLFCTVTPVLERVESACYCWGKRSKQSCFYFSSMNILKGPVSSGIYTLVLHSNILVSICSPNCVDQSCFRGLWLHGGKEFLWRAKETEVKTVVGKGYCLAMIQLSSADICLQRPLFSHLKLLIGL